jgi:hypothetical protein
MKKHAAGFVFFAVIITLFAAGYSVFRSFPIPDIGAVESLDDNPQIPVDGGRPVRVTQAIADPLKKTLAFSLADGDSRPTEVDLAFYNVSADGIRFVRAEVVKLQPEQWTAGKTSSMIRYKTDWLGSSRITDNLYVITTVRHSESRSYELVPFSREQATAVLIAKN